MMTMMGHEGNGLDARGGYNPRQYGGMAERSKAAD
jgi:hypothetical protein